MRLMQTVLFTLLFCGAAALRRQVSNHTHAVSLLASGLQHFKEPEKSDIKTPEEVAKKWDKMGDVLQILFTIACRAKHQKDVHGETAHKLQNEKGMSLDDAMGVRKEIMSKNVGDLKQACGFIVAKQEKNCREGCAKGWNEMQEQRNICDEKCVAVYSKFEKTCMTKADDLVKVNEIELKTMESQQRCLKQHCEEFPTVYTMKEDKQEKEVEDLCKKRCTDERIEKRCQNEFALESDDADAKAASACAEASGAGECIKKKTEKAGGKKDKCSEEKKKSCESDHKECESAGEGDQGKAFCKSRKSMCMEQASKACTEEHQDALKDAKKECEAEAGDEYVKCKEEKMEKAEKEHVDKCKKEKKESCPENCKKKCEVKKMNECLEQFKADDKNDPTQFFCEKMWTFLHETSDIDPVTGEPIVLLSPHKPAPAHIA